MHMIALPLLILCFNQVLTSYPNTSSELIELISLQRTFPNPKKDINGLTRRKQWEDAVKGDRKDISFREHARICSLHFRPEDFDRTGQTVRLRDGVVPSIFHQYACNKTKVSVERRVQRTKKSHVTAKSVVKDAAENVKNGVVKSALNSYPGNFDHLYVREETCNESLTASTCGNIKKNRSDGVANKRSVQSFVPANFDHTYIREEYLNESSILEENCTLGNFQTSDTDASRSKHPSPNFALVNFDHMYIREGLDDPIAEENTLGNFQTSDTDESRSKHASPNFAPVNFDHVYVREVAHDEPMLEENTLGNFQVSDTDASCRKYPTLNFVPAKFDHMYIRDDFHDPIAGKDTLGNFQNSYTVASSSKPSANYQNLYIKEEDIGYYELDGPPQADAGQEEQAAADSASIANKSASNMCRICAKPQPKCIHIFGREGISKNLALKINSSLPIVVSEKDWLPLLVCLQCAIRLDEAYNLHHCCKIADETLRDMFREPLQESCDPQNLSFYAVNTPGYPEAAVQPATSSSIVEESPAGLPILHCDLCNMKTRNADHFCWHQMNLHSRPAVACDQCCIFFSSAMQLHEHCKEIHPDCDNPADNISEHNYQENDAPILTSDQPSPQVPKTNTRVRKRIPRQFYKCKKCDEKFSLENKSEYTIHWKKHLEDDREERLKNSSIQCDFCETKFLKMRSKTAHMTKQHREYRPFSCDICGFKMRTKLAIKCHIMTHVPNKERPFLCDVCGASFVTKTGLNHHTYIHKSHLTKCSVCNKDVPSHRLKQHMRLHNEPHLVECSICFKKLSHISSMYQHMKVHSQVKQQCPICGTLHNRKSHVKLHMKTHINKLTGYYMCPVENCDLELPAEYMLISHCEEHKKREPIVFKHSNARKGPRKGKGGRSSNTFYCCYCTKNVANLPIYIHHMRKHEKDDPRNVLRLNCSLCEQIFNNSSLFFDHLAVHPEAYTYKCKSCPEKFADHSKLLSHTISKHNEKVMCDICSKTFTTKFKLKEHMYVHSGTRMYQCPHCEKSFYQRKTLNQHISIHSGVKSFVCQYCSKGFRLKADLTVHVATHTGMKAHQCQFCRESFHRRTLLAKHLSKKHSYDVYYE